MSKFEEWLPDISAHPEDWIAPIIRSGDAELALELIGKKPALLHLRASGNNTPLQEAAYFGHQELADRLLALGAKMDIVAAIALGRTEIVRIMLENDPTLRHKHSPSGLGLLHIASRHAETEIVPLLLSWGADVHDNRNKQRYTPLFFASLTNAELLLAKGADINARAKHGFTVLHQAAKAGDREWTKFLIKHGARIDLQTDGRQTPWAFAVRRGHRDIAALLRLESL